MYLELCSEPGKLSPVITYSSVLSNRILGLVFLITSLPFANTLAYAATITASGAGPLISSAQDLTGLSPTEIDGSLGTNPDAVNIFKIGISDPAAFFAMTVNTGAFGLPDTELFLFNSSGLGVLFNDDITGGNTKSCLPSVNLSNPCPFSRGGLGPLLPGFYYLAITRSANSPWDAVGNNIFVNSLSTDLVGPAAGAGALAAWDNGEYTQPDYDLSNYAILLAGTAAPTTSTPEPATWLSLAGAAVCLFAFRRSLRSS